MIGGVGLDCETCQDGKHRLSEKTIELKWAILLRIELFGRTDLVTSLFFYPVFYVFRSRDQAVP